MTVSSSWSQLALRRDISAGAVGAQTKKLAGVAFFLSLAGVLIGFYVSGYLVGNTKSFQPTVEAGATPSVNLTLETVAAVGPTEAPNHPDWVSYLVLEKRQVDAQHRLAAAGELARPRDDLQLRRRQRSAQSVPRPPAGSGRSGDRRRQAGRGHAARPAVAHVRRPGARRARADRPGRRRRARTSATTRRARCRRRTARSPFTFRTGKPGHYRWQCFVPCAAGFLYGFGGPMQTIGYMDGFLNVV